jgi:hypothetical protein
MFALTSVHVPQYNDQGQMKYSQNYDCFKGWQKYNSLKKKSEKTRFFQQKNLINFMENVEVILEKYL